MKRWGLSLAFVLTAFQTFCISSPLISWQWIAGVGLSVGFIPNLSFLDMHFLAATSCGASIHFALLHPSHSLLASVAGVSSDTFVLINLIPVVFLFLLGSLREDFRHKLPEA